ncbi:MAG: 3-phosphoshikimate 1-carboxyvinyltransferase [Candidatus Cyclobacteriaceae bacterium M2_1C_046]
MYSSDSIKILKNTNPLKGTINLPSSKSISNRLLIINALSHGRVVINNLSKANDTQVLKKQLLSEGQIMDVGDAGTAMRFLTALKATRGDSCIMQGSPRMHQRPIEPLVVALKTIGAEIDYIDKTGYPPLRLNGFKQVNKEVSVPGNISSQFITALLLVAPALPQGLIIKIEGKLMSLPYVEMTIKLMEKCGIEVKKEPGSFMVAPQQYQPTMIPVESDWSSASYWFSFVSLIPGSDIILTGLQENSMQGDFRILDIAEGWGVKGEFVPAGLRLRNDGHKVDEQMIDFSDIPDLAQTVAVAHALLGIKGKYIGLESLRIKETDRILALQQELSKIGAKFEENGEFWMLTPPEAQFPSQISVETYQDHRMAMAFAPLVSRMDVEILNKDVTKKSYPGFWDDLKSLNFELT